MLLSTSTANLYPRHNIKDVLCILKEAGFDAYDFAFDALEFDDPLFGDDALTIAEDLRNYADSLGILCNQSHAPFHSSFGDKEKDEAMFARIVRSMEVTACLGGKIVVVHPKQHLVYAEHAEELYHMNMEFCKRLIPYCEKFDIKIAIENMYQWNNAAKACTDSTCSRAWEFCKYIDDIGSPYVVGCLDIGHLSLMGTSIPAFIHAMGNKRLYALHVHDTDGKRDCHTLPYLEGINWDEVTEALGSIDYQGDFTFETSPFIRRFPKELANDAEHFLCKVGRYLMSRVDASRPSKERL